MCRNRHPVWLGLVLAAGLTAGCQSRLNVEMAFQLDVGAQKDLEIDAPRHDQKVSVSVTSDAPVNVFVYLQKDRQAVLDARGREKVPPQVLGSAENTPSATVEVTLPAKERGVVTIETGPKAASVKVKITGK